MVEEPSNTIMTINLNYWIATAGLNTTASGTSLACLTKLVNPRSTLSFTLLIFTFDTVAEPFSLAIVVSSAHKFAKFCKTVAMVTSEENKDNGNEVHQFWHFSRDAFATAV
jgi:hypothetical protein